jgi:hypothetical protein
MARSDLVFIAWQCAQQVRSVYHQHTPPAGRVIAEEILASFPSCPSPRAPVSVARSSDGVPRFWPTSTHAAPATAAPKPSTASLSFTAASPEASATATTTGYVCS